MSTLFSSLSSNLSAVLRVLHLPQNIRPLHPISQGLQEAQVVVERPHVSLKIPRTKYLLTVLKRNNRSRHRLLSERNPLKYTTTSASSCTTTTRQTKLQSVLARSFRSSTKMMITEIQAIEDGMVFATSTHDKIKSIEFGQTNCLTTSCC